MIQKNITSPSLKSFASDRPTLKASLRKEKGFYPGTDAHLNATQENPEGSLLCLHRTGGKNKCRTEKNLFYQYEDHVYPKEWGHLFSVFSPERNTKCSFSLVSECILFTLPSSKGFVRCCHHFVSVIVHH